MSLAVARQITKGTPFKSRARQRLWKHTTLYRAWCLVISVEAMQPRLNDACWLGSADLRPSTSTVHVAQHYTYSSPSYARLTRILTGSKNRLSVMEKINFITLIGGVKINSIFDEYTLHLSTNENWCTMTCCDTVAIVQALRSLSSSTLLRELHGDGHNGKNAVMGTELTVIPWGWRQTPR